MEVNMSKTILEVKNLGKTYQAENGEIEALKNISFKEKEGEFVLLASVPNCLCSYEFKWHS